MSHDQRKIFPCPPGSTALYNAAGGFPQQDYLKWRQSFDINQNDLPYLHNLLEESFREWERESSGLKSVTEGSWGVVCPEGKWIAGSPALQTYLMAGDDAALHRCLEQQTLAVDSSPDRLGGSTVSAAPLFTRNGCELFAVLVGVTPPGTDEEKAGLAAESAALLLRSCFYRKFDYLVVADLEKVYEQAAKEARRRSTLFQYVKRMHAQIDVDGVLKEVLDSVIELYPAADVRLFLSQDHQSNHPLVLPLLLNHWQEEVYVRTFMEGTLTVSRSRNGLNGQEQAEIGVPVGGKQGVYGVLHIEAAGDAMGEIDLELLEMMGDAAGSAFENAKLYEQSNLMIHEFRIINELTQRLNKSLQLEDIYQFANQELRKILDAEYCCILSYNEDLNGLEVVSTNASWLKKEVFETSYGLGGIVFHSKEPMLLANYLEERPAESKLMESTGSNSVIATPLNVNGETRGVILLTHRKKHYFSYDNYRLLQSLASHIGLAVGNASLHAEVRRMANRDMLTELYARHYLDEVIYECQSRDFCGSLIVVDIDQFKQVNDTFGHQLGDKILKQVSHIIRSSIRQSDVPARWGGEELAVYLPGIGIDQALQIAERIRIRVAEETEPRVTVSCGISEWDWTNDRISVESLFYRADMALYEAKHSGRNMVIAEKLDEEAESHKES